jgi:antitoxin ParD1/3/4
MVAKASVSLTEAQHAFARDLVESGRFASVSSVVQQGVELLRDKLEGERLEREALASLLAERRKGNFVSDLEMERRVEAMLARKRAADAG